MGRAYIDEDSHGWSGNLAEVSDVTLPPHPHLEHEVFGRFVGPQDGERHSDLGVEGACCGNGPAASAKYLRDEILRTRLAARTGDCHDRACQPVGANPMGESTECVDRIVNDETWAVNHPSRQCHAGSALASLRSEGMAIGPLTGNRHEHRSRRGLTRVDDDIGNPGRDINLMADTANDGTYLPYGHGNH